METDTGLGSQSVVRVSDSSSNGAAHHDARVLITGRSFGLSQIGLKSTITA